MPLQLAVTRIHRTSGLPPNAQGLRPSAQHPYHGHSILEKLAGVKYHIYTYGQTALTMPERYGII